MIVVFLNSTWFCVFSNDSKAQIKNKSAFNPEKLLLKLLFVQNYGL